MHCQKCGDECCTEYTIYGYTDEDFIEFLKAHYGVEVIEAVQLKIPHRCIHLTDEGLCDIYENRPKMCREYQCKKMKSNEKGIG